jgi:hypothetical protein
MLPTARRHAACRATRAPLDALRRSTVIEASALAREDIETGPAGH